MADDIVSTVQGLALQFYTSEPHVNSAKYLSSRYTYSKPGSVFYTLFQPQCTLCWTLSFSDVHAYEAPAGGISLRAREHIQPPRQPLSGCFKYYTQTMAILMILKSLSAIHIMTGCSVDGFTLELISRRTTCNSGYT